MRARNCNRIAGVCVTMSWSIRGLTSNARFSLSTIVDSFAVFLFTFKTSICMLKQSTMRMGQWFELCHSLLLLTYAVECVCNCLFAVIQTHFHRSCFVFEYFKQISINVRRTNNAKDVIILALFWNLALFWHEKSHIPIVRFQIARICF